jgi:hypothetical protein
MKKSNTNSILFAALAIAIASISCSMIGNENFVSATNNNQEQLPAISQIGHHYLGNCLSDNGGDGDTSRFEPLGCSPDVDNIHVATQRSDVHVSGAVDTMNYNTLGDNYIQDQFGNYFEDPDQVGWD